MTTRPHPRALTLKRLRRRISYSEFPSTCQSARNIERLIKEIESQEPSK